MTPSAMTAAGRAAAGRATVRPAPDHRRQLRRRAAPAVPRRVSGPAVARPRTAPSRHHATLGTRALAVVRSLPEHSLIDRLVSGRAWIPVLGVLLAGIIAMQVEVLKLGTSIGNYVQRSTALQSQNESLQASVASLNDDQRIERLAAGMGMVMPGPTTIAFLHLAPGTDASRALASIHAPDPTGFAGQLAAQAASAAAATAATSPSTSNASNASSASSTSNASSASSTSATQSSSTGAPATGSPATQTTAPTAPTAQTSSSTVSGSGTQTSATGAAAIAPSGSFQPSGSTGR